MRMSCGEGVEDGNVLFKMVGCVSSSISPFSRI